MISRSITETGTPFTFLDRKYATKQTSGDEFIYFTEFGMSYIEQSDGDKLGEVKLHTVG